LNSLLQEINDGLHFDKKSKFVESPQPHL